MDKEWRTIRVNKQAAETILAMEERANMLSAYYGVDHKWTQEANKTLRHNLAHLFSKFFGDTAVITKDGELSLFVQERESRFVYGLIFHPVRNKCQNEGCDMYTHSDGKTYHYKPTGEENNCHDHKWLYPLNAPVPGSWSFHS